MKKLISVFIIILLSFAILPLVIDMSDNKDVAFNNVLEGGDFSSDDNSDGLANNWYAYQTGFTSGKITTGNIDGGVQYIRSASLASAIFLEYEPSVEFINDDIYYFSIDVGYGNLPVFPELMVGGNVIELSNVKNTELITYSQLFNFSSYSDNIFQLFQDSNNNNTITILTDNAILFNLTKLYGEGLEPTLEELEITLIDAPDYFDEYTYYQYGIGITDASENMLRLVPTFFILIIVGFVVVYIKTKK